MTLGTRREQASSDRAAGIASVLLAAGSPVSIADLARSVLCSVEEIQETLDQMVYDFRGGIRLQRDRDCVQLVTAPDQVDVVRRYFGSQKPPPLSRAVLETLAVIAYRQPVTRSEIESLRGVNSDRAVQTLLARELIEDQGTRSTLGRPTQYGTTFAFLEYFGLHSLRDLPPLAPNMAIDAPTTSGQNT